MPINTDPQFVGRATITPEADIAAGQMGSWTITYEVGAYGYDERARLKIATRFASDWGQPQFSDPKGKNYTTVRLETKGSAIVRAAFDARGHVRPWFKCIVVSLHDGSLAQGDKIHVTIGDTSAGGPGARAQTFREHGCEWRVFVDPFGTEIYTALDPSPQLNVVGGGLNHVVAIAPTTVRPGEPFDVVVRVEDAWGNPCERFDGEIKFGLHGSPVDGLPASVPVRRGEPAVKRVSGLRLGAPGAETRITAGVGFHRGETNLIRAIADGDPKTYWADLHGQTKGTVGTGTIEEYFAFGRDTALLDVMCHQANDFQVTDAEWQSLKQETGRFHEDHRFVVFLGYEWSGMTPGGGDRNVIFRGDNATIHRSSHAEVDDMGDAGSDCFPLTRLFEQFKGRDDVMLIPHVGGRYADIAAFHDPSLEKLIEVYSDWGRFEWMIEDAIRHGYKVGFVANSDGHKGRPGASHPGGSTFGVYGGLTCILADGLTRDSIFDALRQRRCYAVSAAQRIHVELKVNDLLMGAEGKLEPKGPVKIAGRVIGTGPIERVDVFRDLDIIATVSPYKLESFQGSKRYRIAWAGSRVRGRDRLVKWDGHVEVSEGKIAGATPYSMDNPEKTVTQASPTQISWISTTTGDDEGVDLKLEAPDNAVLKFRTPIIDVDVALTELANGSTKVFPAGGVDQRVSVRRLPAKDTVNELAIEVTDQSPAGGKTHAYWIRVTQEDGAQAWTSPVYLET